LRDVVLNYFKRRSALFSFYVALFILLKLVDNFMRDGRLLKRSDEPFKRLKALLIHLRLFSLILKDDGLKKSNTHVSVAPPLENQKRAATVAVAPEQPM
jgi:hypothetical protein